MFRTATGPIVGCAVVVVTVLTNSACSAIGWSRPEPRDTVLLVASAISMSDALAVAASEFEETHGVSVVVNAAGSDTLATQLIAGAPADLFLSADVRQVARVSAEGLIRSDDTVRLFSNQLTAVVHVDSTLGVESVGDLRSPRVARIALGDPASVPAGVYAREYLQSIGHWESLREKVIPTRNVRAALATVEAGHADVALVYRTDAATTDRVMVAFAVPLASGPSILYVGATLMASTYQAEARRFLAFLGGDGGRAFEAAGFIRPRHTAGRSGSS